MLRIIAAALIGLIIVRGTYAVVIGIRDGLIGRRIAAPGARANRVYEDQAALRYGWFSIFGGLSLALLGLWALWRIVTD